MHPTLQPVVPLLLTTDPSAKHLLSQERLPFTATYFGSIGLTLYFAVGVRCPLSSHHISLHYTTPSTAVSSLPIAHSIINHKSSQRPSSLLRNHRENLASPDGFGQFSISIRPPTHHNPTSTVSNFTSPPTLTLFSFSLASKCPPHAHLVHRSARRFGLVPRVVLPHGLTRLALRCALWRKPHHRYDEWLNWDCSRVCAWTMGLM
jgi:hypothetical protein